MIEIAVIFLLLTHFRKLDDHTKALNRHVERLDNRVRELERHTEHIKASVGGLSTSPRKREG